MDLIEALPAIAERCPPAAHGGRRQTKIAADLTPLVALLEAQ